MPSLQDRPIILRVARRFASYRRFYAFGVNDLNKLSRMGRSFGVISAYRTELKKHENQARHGQLTAELQKDGYHFDDFKAPWKDEATGLTKKEKSIIVPNIDFDRLFDLCKKYKQDAVIYKDPSGSVGIYGKNGKATMAYDPKGEMAITKSLDRNQDYSRGRSLSFGLQLVDKEFEHHGKPITREDIIEAISG